MASYERMLFIVGETFASYARARNKKRRNKRTNVVQPVHRDSRTLEAARKRVPKRVEEANEDLHYNSINLSCSFGCKDYKTKEMV